MKVLILDLVHGGHILAGCFLGRGDVVTAVDVYKVAKEELVSELIRKGVRIVDSAPAEKFDLLVMPCHCPDSFIGPAVCSEKVSFSGAVQMFMKAGPFRIEVTGVKGKTSTCYLLAHILDSWGKKVFLHTSRGQGPYRNGLHDTTALKSIAPPSLLELPVTGYDIIVSEVSLGGSGCADMSVITNLAEDYPIAAGTSRASEGKAEVICSGINFVKEGELSFWKGKRSDADFRTFGSFCSYDGSPRLGDPVRIQYRYGGSECSTYLKGDYIVLQYLNCIDAVIPVCEELGITQEVFADAISSFGGVPGRGEIRRKGDGWEVIERNPGISPLSVNNTLSVLRDMGVTGDCFVIVEPVSKKVCDKMRIGDIIQILRGYGVNYAVTDGESVPPVPHGYHTVVRFIKEGWQ